MLASGVKLSPTVVLLAFLFERYLSGRSIGVGGRVASFQRRELGTATLPFTAAPDDELHSYSDGSIISVFELDFEVKADR